jgi:hypothetical protein
MANVAAETGLLVQVSVQVAPAAPASASAKLQATTYVEGW